MIIYQSFFTASLKILKYFYFWMIINELFVDLLLGSFLMQKKHLGFLQLFKTETDLEINEEGEIF